MGVTGKKEKTKLQEEITISKNDKKKSVNSWFAWLRIQAQNNDCLLISITEVGRLLHSLTVREKQAVLVCYHVDPWEIVHCVV